MKVKKVRTSITIDPAVLEQVRQAVENPHSSWKSVAQFIEAAVRQQVGSLPVADYLDNPVYSDDNSLVVEPE